MSRPNRSDRAHRATTRRAGRRGVVPKSSETRPVVDRLGNAAEILWHDLRHAARSLRSAPGFTITAALTLALGIGANAAMFGVLDRLLLSPPAHIEDPDEVVRLYVRREFMGEPVTTSSLTYPDFRDFADARHFAAAAYAGWRVVLGEGEGARRIANRYVSGDYFPLLGATPELGRFFAAQDDRAGAADLVVLGFDLWQQEFRGDRDVLGRTIRLGGQAHTIIGVAPQGFTGSDLQRVDAWMPLRSPANTGMENWEDNRGWYWLEALARIAPGSTVAVAEAEATAAHRAGREQSERYDREAEVILGPLVTARGEHRSDESMVARWLLAVSGVVLLIACANIANLLLSRGLRRQPEIVLRVALGSSRARLVAQLLTESAALAVLGGLGALVAAFHGATLIRRTLLPGIHWASTPLDHRVLLFTLAATLTTGVVIGLIPALQASRPNLTGPLRGASRAGPTGSRRTRGLLVVAQAALSVVLLVGAGLFVRSLQHAVELDLGFDASGVFLAVPEFEPGAMSPEAVTPFFSAAMERLRYLPGVSDVAASESAPFYNSHGERIRLPGRSPDELPQFSTGGPYIISVTEDYFATMQLPILRGRGFGPEDGAGAPLVAVVEEEMARAYWPEDDPLGQCILIGDGDPPCTTVVGIAPKTPRQGLTEGPTAQYYVPLQQRAGHDVPQIFFVRIARVAAAGLTRAIGREIQAAAPGVRYVGVRPLGEFISSEQRQWRLGATMFSVFGFVALAIAAVGQYGVLAFAVAERSHEIGVRSALGATRARVLGLVAGQAMRLTGAGLTAGMLIAWLAAQRIAPLLFGVEPGDPWTLVSVAMAILCVAALASYLPARRAARIDPIVALKGE